MWTPRCIAWHTGEEAKSMEPRTPMQTRTPGASWFVRISASVAAGLIFFYFYSSRPQPDQSSAPAAGPYEQSGSPAISERRAPSEPPALADRHPPLQAATSELKVSVNGVMITPSSKSALISVEGRPATVFVEGQQILDGVVLYAVNPDRISVKRGDELVPLTLRGTPSAGNAGALQSAEAAGGAELVSAVQTPPPAPGTEERRMWQSQNRD
jgi:hypothetical protein